MPDSTQLQSDVLTIVRPDSPNMWQGYTIGKPTSTHDYIEDFDYYSAGNYTITAVGTGTTALATAAPTVGGVLVVTTSALQNDSRSHQKVGHSFVPTVGTNIWAEARLQVDDATNANFFWGLLDTNTAPLTSQANGCFFSKATVTALSFATALSSTATSDTSVFTVAANTYMKLGFKITGTSQVEYWVNDVLKGTFTTNIPTAPLRVTFQCLAGSAVARVMSLDYIMVCQQRI